MSFRKTWIIVSCCLLFGTSVVQAETPISMAQSAQEKFQQGDYQAALQDWQALFALGLINGDLYDNMAHAYWQLGQVGQARFYWLKAQRLKPRDSSIRHNLEFLEKKLNLAEKSDGLWGALKRVPWWRLTLNYYEALFLAAFLSLLFFGTLFRAKKRRRQVSFRWAVSLGVLFFLSLIALGYRASEHYFSRQAIVLKSQTPLLKAPAQEAVSGETLPEGSSLTIRKKQGDFRLVKTPSSQEGWVEANSIGKL